MPLPLLCLLTTFALASPALAEERPLTAAEAAREEQLRNARRKQWREMSDEEKERVRAERNQEIELMPTDNRRTHIVAPTPPTPPSPPSFAPIATEHTEKTTSTHTPDETNVTTETLTPKKPPTRHPEPPKEEAEPAPPKASPQKGTKVSIDDILRKHGVN